jgi:type IV pilus assembly protein PilQ
MRTHPLLLTSALALLAASPLAFGQPAPVVGAPAQPAAPAKEAGKDTLSVDFPDEDIRNILRNVADLFELNLVMPEALQGKTTIKLRDVTWRQIFKNVLEPVGYSYVEEGNIIKIVNNDTLLKEPTSTEVFILNYARAADIMPTVSSLVDGTAGGKIVVDARSNGLVITERPSRMNSIRPIIEKLDKATDQVMIETKFIEVTTGDVKNLGVNWKSLSGYNVSAGAFRQEYSDVNGRDRTAGASQTNLNVPYMQDGYAKTAQLAGVNAVGPKVTYTVDPRFPAVGTPGTAGYIPPQFQSEIPDQKVGSTDTLDFLSNITRTTTAVFDAAQFNIVLSALQTLQSTKVVSNPTVVTLNNAEATINVGESRPLPRYAFNEQRGTFEVNGFEFKDIGVNLKVTPQVNGTGFIKLKVEPEVSQSTRDAVFNGAAIPIIDVRKAKTEVSLKDGSTMGIGGLIKTASGTGKTKVPVLGSIPVFGRLFKSDSKSQDTTNLLIFITAKVVSAQGATIDQVFDPRAIRETGIKRDELPGYRDGSDPFAAVVAPVVAKKSGEIAKADSATAK